MEREAERDFYGGGRSQEPRNAAVGAGKGKQVAFFLEPPERKAPLPTP